MGLTIAYLILILTGGACIGFTIWEHKKCKQKDIDTEFANENLKRINQELELISQELNYKIEKKKDEDAYLLNSIQLKQKENSVLQNNQENLNQVINELSQQKQNLIIEIQLFEQEKENLNQQYTETEARLGALKRSIDDLSRSQREIARASFESYCEALDSEYQKAETEYDNLISLLQETYDTQKEELQKIFLKEQRMYKENLDVIYKELEKIRATKAAAMEAQLREEEIKNQATFYMLQLNDADKTDIAYLRNIEHNLREPRPLRMLIWTTFYRDKANDLAARVGAVGACGIYKLTHTESGISYIGQARNIKDRWVEHIKCSLGIDTPVTSQLYAFTREKGIENFTFEVLETCTQAELNEKERTYIDMYQTKDFGLNKTKGNK